MVHPKVSIITACYNSEEYLEECILSIMRQNYNNVEHIIVDGASTDHTLDIIKRYEGQYNMRWISEKDKGMYDAISKGFKMATGDIFAWLNSDDMYLPWACKLVSKVFEKTSVRWCTGIPCFYTADGVSYHAPRVTPVYPQSFIRKGYMDGRVYGFLEQESMFWSRELWDKAGSVLPSYKIAGDYFLWREFAKYEKLYTLDSVISGFRIHPGQKSENIEKYYSEVGTLSFGRKILRKTHIIWILCLLLSLVSNRLRLKTETVLYE